MNALPEPPYSVDTRAKGWRFELDLERVMQSDTWVLTSPELRPWLLMLWTVAWQQVPCGSMPSEDALIAARIGMKPAAFKKAREVLMRGWWAASDGRLYHGTITERVREMLDRKEGERKRKADYRARMDAERKASESLGVPNMSHGTDMGQTRESGGRDDTGTGTGTGTGFIKTLNPSVPDGTDADASIGLSPHEAIFQIGVPWMVAHGGKESSVRSMLGGAEKHLTPAGAWQLVQECMAAKPLEPVAWIAAALNTRKKVAGGAAPARRGIPMQSDIDAENAKAKAMVFGKSSEVIDV